MNRISIVEIPVRDFSRAVSFYQNILGVTFEETEMAETQMGVIPCDEGSVSVVLVKGDGYRPSMEGATVYLNGGDDLQPTLDKATASGGQTIIPKTEISPEMGYFAIFIDCEGNKIGLHSSR